MNQDEKLQAILTTLLLVMDKLDRIEVQLKHSGTFAKALEEVRETKFEPRS